MKPWVVRKVFRILNYTSRSRPYFRKYFYVLLSKKLETLAETRSNLYTIYGVRRFTLFIARSCFTWTLEVLLICICRCSFEFHCFIPPIKRLDWAIVLCRWKPFLYFERWLVLNLTDAHKRVANVADLCHCPSTQFFSHKNISSGSITPWHSIIFFS